MQQLAPLTGSIKHYDWGGISYIPSLLQIENPNMQPFAEYWMGVHPQADCKLKLDNGTEVFLRDYIAAAPEKTLGKKLFKRFGNMPYLLKVLDVKDMLSIQVHPSKEQAAIDFEAENQKGVPLNASNRNYKDTNHKPELMVAMSDFYLLHGFKPEDELLAVLDAVKELNIFKIAFKNKGYKRLYKRAMQMPQDEVNKRLQPLLNRIIPLYHSGKLPKHEAHFWAARAALTFDRPGVIDRGIFSIYFFNLLFLKKGQAVFQDAGVPHAYLEGQNVEIMASSDNVLRGGLTAKHIDTAELLKHTRCQATHPKIMNPSKSSSHQVYKTPVRDFLLTSYLIKKDESIRLDIATTELFLLMEGKATLRYKKTKVALERPAIAAAAFAGAVVTIKAKKDAWLFRAAAK